MSGFGWSGLVLMDPSVLDRQFDDSDSMSAMDLTIHEELNEEGFEQVEIIRSVLDRIPPREADFIELYYFQRIKQTTIAQIFNVSQPTICYRLSRAAKRIKFLLKLPYFKEGEVLEAMLRVLPDRMDAEIMCGVLETTSQSEVAKRFNVSQGFVRYRFFRSLQILEGIPEMSRYLEAFKLVSENLNVMREVYRAQWCEPVIHLVM
jgi:DNA-directed RNA polymerase specialized sigma24 family protein